MLSRKIEDGYIGVSVNCDKTHVLLQLTKEEEQIRIKLNAKETDNLIESLKLAVKDLKPETTYPL
jgi:predicted nucleic acid-binding Zn ribbon protein